MEGYYIKYTNSGLKVKENLIINLIRYWSSREDSPLVDNYQWAYLSYNKIAEVTGMSVSSVRRAVAKLSAEGILIIGNFNKHQFDRTQWYRINEEVLAEKMKTFSEKNSGKTPKKMSTTMCSKCTNASAQNEHVQVFKMDTCKCSKWHDNTNKIKIKEKEKGKSVAIATHSPEVSAKKNLAEILSDYKPKILISKIEDKEIKKQNSISNFFTVFFLLLAEKYSRNVKLSPTSKERGLVRTLIRTLNNNNITVTKFLSFTFSNWEIIRQKLVWEDSKKPRLAEVPSVSEICYVHKDIIDIMLSAVGTTTSQPKTPLVDKAKIRELYERRKHEYKNRRQNGNSID